ncbi:MAG: amino acid--tRNA ligase-related protein, partial [Patescibacteria group bacterium]
MVSFKIDEYFQSLKAPRVDLYMVTSSVSSPMGKGSDSEPWPIKMGEADTHLVDSAQFGMEPLVQKNFDLVYCYLPSFRGEVPDKHHLSQFYHCEAELKGSISKCMQIVKDLLVELFSLFNDKEFAKLIDAERLPKLKDISSQSIKSIDFNKAVKILNNDINYVESSPHGRKITREGEIELSRLLYNHKSIFWLTGFDRDIV